MRKTSLAFLLGVAAVLFCTTDAWADRSPHIIAKKTRFENFKEIILDAAHRSGVEAPFVYMEHNSLEINQNSAHAYLITLGLDMPIKATWAISVDNLYLVRAGNSQMRFQVSSMVCLKKLNMLGMKGEPTPIDIRNMEECIFNTAGQALYLTHLHLLIATNPQFENLSGLSDEVLLRTIREYFADPPGGRAVK